MFWLVLLLLMLLIPAIVAIGVWRDTRRVAVSDELPGPVSGLREASDQGIP